MNIAHCKKLFNEFSNLPKKELAQIISKMIEQDTTEDAIKNAETARALFVACCYDAATKNAMEKNDELCKFYSSVLSDMYK